MSDNLHIEETIKSEKIYEGRIIKVRVDTVELETEVMLKGKLLNMIEVLV